MNLIARIPLCKSLALAAASSLLVSCSYVAKAPGMNKLVGELGLQEAIPVPDLRRTAFGRPLDHLYYRNLDLVEVSSPATDASDHNPIMARFAAQAITP